MLVAALSAQTHDLNELDFPAGGHLEGYQQKDAQKIHLNALPGLVSTKPLAW